MMVNKMTLKKRSAGNQDNIIPDGCSKDSRGDNKGSINERLS